jgi:hypothetical protein
MFQQKRRRKMKRLRSSLKEECTKGKKKKTLESRLDPSKQDFP